METLAYTDPLVNLLDLSRETAWTAAELALPVLIAAFAVSLAVAVLQALTQIQDQTLSSVPRLGAIALAVALLLPWMLETAVELTRTVLGSLGGGGLP